MKQVEIEVPYGTKILLPFDGSESILKALFAAQLVERYWRDDDDKVAYRAKDKLVVNYVDYKVEDRPPPEPEPPVQ